MILYPTLHLGRALPPFRIDDVFRVVTATGANLQDAIEATGLNPDLIIAKDIQSSSDWIWLAPSEMPGQKLSSNQTGPASSFSGFSGGNMHVAYLFKRNKGFLDIVTWTGNGGTTREIPHQLGVAPGWIMSKCRSEDLSWLVLPRLDVASYYLFDFPSAQNPAAGGYKEPAGALSFKIGSDDVINAAGKQYIAFLFGQTDASWGAIRCGRFTTVSSTEMRIPHGWREGAQLLMITSRTGPTWGTEEFFDIYDTARSPGWAGEQKIKFTSAAAQSSGIDITDSDGVMTISGLAGATSGRDYDVMMIRAAA